MKKLMIFGAVITLCLACGEEEGDGAVWICDGGVNPHCGPGNRFVFSLGGDIFYCDGSGRRLTRVTETRELYETWPFWAPDGEYIVFSGLDKLTAEEDIYKIRKDGTGLSRLTYTGGVCPAWSPDGGAIVYNGRSDSDIWAISANDREPRRLTKRGWCASPAWSPDGARIYFAGPDPKDPDGPYSLWYVDPAGQKVVRLWSYADSFHDLAVRPGGGWLAAEFYAGGRENIWLIEIKTGKRYRLTDEPEPDYGD